MIKVNNYRDTQLFKNGFKNHLHTVKPLLENSKKCDYIQILIVFLSNK